MPLPALPPATPADAACRQRRLIAELSGCHLSPPLSFDIFIFDIFFATLRH
jgi:hypothetical protein